MKWIKNILKSTYFHIFSSLAIGAIVIIFLILPGYNYAWTGFNSETDPKTLWDWLELLIIPFVLAVGGYYLAKSEREEDREIAKQERETDLEIALNRQEELQVQNYLDRMSELLIDKDLLNSEKEEIINIAKARTTTILKSITDKTRQATIIQFLRASNLLETDQKIQLLKNAYLSGADLNGVNLSRANLLGTNLREANLSEAILSEADLSKANLMGARLISTYLWRADLKKAYLSKADLKKAYLSKADLKKPT